MCDPSFFRQINNVCRNWDSANDEDRRSIRQIRDALRRAQTTESIRVFRGQFMSAQKFDVLRNLVNKHIVINSFLSTTTDRAVALMFSGPQTNINGMVSVIYVTDGTYQQGMRPFADIANYSRFQDESEVLFMARSVFRIDAIHRQDENGLFIIHMTVAGGDQDELYELNN